MGRKGEDRDLGRATRRVGRMMPGDVVKMVAPNLWRTIAGLPLDDLIAAFVGDICRALGKVCGVACPTSHPSLSTAPGARFRSRRGVLLPSRRILTALCPEASPLTTHVARGSFSCALSTPASQTAHCLPFAPIESLRLRSVNIRRRFSRCPLTANQGF